jgi:hypothetical protein
MEPSHVSGTQTFWQSFVPGSSTMVIASPAFAVQEQMLRKDRVAPDSLHVSANTEQTFHYLT